MNVITLVAFPFAVVVFAKESTKLYMEERKLSVVNHTTNSLRDVCAER